MYNQLLESLEKDNALFSVRSEPLTHNGLIVPERFAQIREDNGSVIGIVGKNYNTVNHVESLEKAYDLIKPLSPEMDIRSWIIRNGKIITEFKLRSLQFMEGKEKSIPSITIKNSYDGSTPMEILMGAVRLICSNGLFIMDIAERIMRERHRGTLDLTKIQNIPHSIEYNTNAVRVLYKTLDGMEIVEWNDPNLAKIGTRLVEKAHGVYEADGRGSRWAQYNAFTNIITHNTKGEKEISPEAKILNYRMLNSVLLPNL